MYRAASRASRSAKDRQSSRSDVGEVDPAIFHVVAGCVAAGDGVAAGDVTETFGPADRADERQEERRDEADNHAGHNLRRHNSFMARPVIAVLSRSFTRSWAASLLSSHLLTRHEIPGLAA
eukprot:SAG11_NODE_286_length_11220_cov_11.922399_7_plen_121_part_00